MHNHPFLRQSWQQSASQNPSEISLPLQTPNDTIQRYGRIRSPKDPQRLRNDTPNRSKVDLGSLQGAKWWPSGYRCSSLTSKINENRQKHSKLVPKIWLPATEIRTDKISIINLNSNNHVNIVNTTKNNPNYQQNWKCQLQGAGGRGRSPLDFPE